MDYGDDETDIKSVLKIDPSVQKFAEIPAFAKRFSLAYIEPVGAACADVTL